MHEKQNNKSLSNDFRNDYKQDVGLIKLGKALKLNEKVTKIQLPTKGIALKNGTLTITSWITVTDKQLFSNLTMALRVKHVPVYSKNCNNILHDDNNCTLFNKGIKICGVITINVSNRQFFLR